MRAVSRITSRQHPVVRRCRQLASKRRDGDPVLLDGEHLIVDALEARVPIELVCTYDADAPVARRAAASGATIHAVSESVMAAASPVRSPSGWLALAAWRPATLGAVLGASNRAGAGPVIALHDVQDPGNLGAAIRSADGLGASGCLALDRTARPDGWKAIRGAMGSTFRLPIAVAPLTTALERARARRLAVFATVAAGGLPIEDADLASPCMVLLGNEGAGLPDVEDATRVTIPMASGVESINVAVAAALILYEARRQRKDRP
ncbi:MAG TPA: RNA methyltransferase [Vicinamibacterales bacterium]|nr:RNA methyltransferase [Vicinamibacterales bacterium]